MELNRRGFGVHVIIHPVMQRAPRRRRRACSRCSRRTPMPTADVPAESVIHAEVDRQTDPAELEQLDRAPAARDRRGARRRRGLAGDARPRAASSARSSRRAPPPIDAADVDEAAAFLAWLADDHFTFLGYREYDLLEDGEDTALRQVDGLRPRESCAPTRPQRALQPVPAAAARVRALAREPFLLNLTKANSRATVHRPAYLDYVGVKRFDADGRVIGRAALPGPVHARRPTTRARARSRSCAASSTPSWRAPRSRRTATTRRR